MGVADTVRHYRHDLGVAGVPNSHQAGAHQAVRAPGWSACLPLHAVLREPSIETLVGGGRGVKPGYIGAVPRPDVEVRRSSRRRKTARAFVEGGHYVVEVPAHLPQSALTDTVERLVERLERRCEGMDEVELTDRAAYLGREHVEPLVGQPLPKYSIRWVSNQRRRWGSCTPANATIRMSERLRVLPDYVRDYVIVHELIHLVEPGHGPRFHEVLGAYPDAIRARAFLDGYSAGAGWEPSDG